MDQKSFSTIQNNFRKFLNEKTHPPTEMPLLTSVTHNPNQKIERMEKTRIFGKDDCEIGYKISFTDKHGKRTTKIVSI